MIGTKDAFDLMIVHYLGLDHIGHLQGPGSNLMVPKLREMDDIIKMIFETLQQDDEKRCQAHDSSTVQDSCSSLLVLVSDHGMNNIGNHGGSSDPEKSTLMIFASPTFTDRFGSTINDPKTSKQLFQELGKCQQIDFSPTISFLMGLERHPQHSVGRTIPILDSFYSTRESLMIHKQTCRQLLSLFASVCGLKTQGLDENAWNKNDDLLYSLNPKLSDLMKEYHDAEAQQPNETNISHLKDRFQDISKETSDALKESLTLIDLSSLFSGLFMLFLSFLGFCDLAETIKSDFLGLLNHDQVFCCFSIKRLRTMILTAFSFLLLSLWVDLNLSSFQWMCCWILSSEMMTRGERFLRLWISNALKTIRNVVIKRSVDLSKTKMWFLFGSLLVLSSMGASSLVEEEQNTWYFLCGTTLILILASNINNHNKNNKLNDKNTWLSIVALGIFRLLSNWNQTGVKWIDEMDIHKFILSNNSFLVLQIFLIISSNLSLLMFPFDVPQTKIEVMMQIATFFLISSYRIIQILWVSIDGMHFVARLCFAFIFLQLSFRILMLFWTKGNPTTIILVDLLRCTARSFVQLSLLLQKPLNSPVVIFITVLSLIFSKIIREKESESSVHQSIEERWEGIVKSVTRSQMMIVWFGNAAFFLLGNSNSVSTIDISGAYTGVSEYNSLIVGILTFVILFGGPTIVFLLCICGLSCFERASLVDSATRTAHIRLLIVRLGTWQSILNVIFCLLVFFFRHHLFIWTVFCPKLLFLVGFSVLHLLFLSLLLGLSVLFP